MWELGLELELDVSILNRGAPGGAFVGVVSGWAVGRLTGLAAAARVVAAEQLSADLVHHQL